MLPRQICGIALMQYRLVRQDLEQIWPIFYWPLGTIPTLAILVDTGRVDLAGYALVASLLTTVGQVAFFSGGEIVAKDKVGETLELLIVSPVSYSLVLLVRLVILTSLGLLAAAGETWLISRFIFGLDPAIHHPWLAILAILVTLLAVATAAFLAATLFALARATRVFQTSIGAPMYLLGGVLIPVAYLPLWLHPLSRINLFTWSANLFRSVFVAGPATSAGTQLLMLVGLGLVTGVIGHLCLGRILRHLRQEGTLTFR